MPGHANWKTLYGAELFQLREEGYAVDAWLAQAARGSALDQAQQSTAEATDCVTPDLAENVWQAAYAELWQVRAWGIRPDFAYVEPDTYDEIIAAAVGTDAWPTPTPLDDDAYADRVHGAWAGRCAGVVLGKPLEMHYDRQQVAAYLQSVDAYPLDNWVPAHSPALKVTLRTDCLPSTRGAVRFVQPDDDLHYTVMSLLLAEQKGLNFTKLDVGQNLIEQVPYKWLWVADSQAYYHLVNLNDERGHAEQVDEIPTKLNPWRECMDGQLKADFWGYIFPGDPVAAARLIHRQSALSLVKNGLYGGMFVAGCISAALTANPTLATILAGGLAVIPHCSRLAEAIRNVMGWYAAAQTLADEARWITVADQIYAAYGHWYFAATINNLAFVTLALLHGNLDFTKTITTAVMCGTDTDCNSATSGSIVGAAIGYARLDPCWIEPLHDSVQTVVADFGHGSISGLAARTVRVHRQWVKGAAQS
jgi:hypothetical protein